MKKVIALLFVVFILCILLVGAMAENPEIKEIDNSILVSILKEMDDFPYLDKMFKYNELSQKFAIVVALFDLDRHADSYSFGSEDYFFTLQDSANIMLFIPDQNEDYYLYSFSSLSEKAMYSVLKNTTSETIRMAVESQGHYLKKYSASDILLAAKQLIE